MEHDDSIVLDPQARTFLDLMADVPPLDTQSADRNRADSAEMMALTGQPRDVASVQDLELAGPDGPVRVRAYRPRAGDGLPVVVYLHGGGWVLGGLDLADTIARDIAVHSSAAVVSVDYRLAPENPFPAAVTDALAVTEALLRGRLPGVDPMRVAVAGDSAGGNLAAVAAQQLRGEPGLRHQALIYPVTQARIGATASYRRFADGYFLTVRDIRYFFGCYAPGVDPDDPRLAPAASPDLGGLVPATVVTAECDPLRDEGESYAAALRAAGVPVTLRRYAGQVHPFVSLGGIIDDARRARRFVGERLRESLHAS
jgi:acetyl esterase/lipase